MGKKNKKHRPKKSNPAPRRASGIVPRATARDESVADGLAVQVASPRLVAAEPKAVELAAVEPEATPSEVVPAEVPAEMDGSGTGGITRHAMLRPQEMTGLERHLAPADRQAPKLDVVTDGVPPASADTSSVNAPADASPAEASTEEHRSSPRVAVAVDIHLASDSHFFSGLSGDISEGGLFFSTYRPLHVGTEVDLEFSLPGADRALRARGEVRWIRDHSAYQPRGVGIAFEDLSDEDRERIHDFCSSRPPLYYEDVG